MVNRPFELLGALSKNRLCLGGGVYLDTEMQCSMS